jgi:FKBP-type peptidyl-prolyl cis-trans isomerase FklB
MRSKTILIFALAAGVAAAQDSPALKTQNERISYALGMDLGNQLRKVGVQVDSAVFAEALKDALSGGKLLLSEAEAGAAISELQAGLKQKEAARRKGTGDDTSESQLLSVYNRMKGEALLAEKRKLQGTVTLPSGLQYRVLKTGAGKKPGLEDTVTCNYRGTLIDGTEFFNTYTRQQPITVKVKETIKGFTEALQLMPVGSKWELYVPPDLAYGDRGAGPIGPNATLTYEVELLDIK